MTIVAVSLKMYFDRARTLSYCDSLASISTHPATRGSDASVTMAIYTDFLTLDAARSHLADTPVMLGAQNLAPADRGAYTGEVSGADLAAFGVQTVEVGHFERRTIFKEDEAMVSAKTQAALRNNLIPMLCVGEPEQIDPKKAATICADQIRSAVNGSTASTIWVGYEPYWAIGAPQPAPVSYVQDVCTSLRAQLTDSCPAASIVYGGSAGPGLLTKLGDAVDGVFLGRFAHDPAALAAVVDEAAAR